MCLTAFKAVMYMGGGKEGEEEANNNERKMIRRPPPSDTDKWNDLPEVPNRTEIGYLHLSFEYQRGTLRVRVWQISDLLLPPPQISMIHSIFVRGYFLPDKVKKTFRRTEEVLVELPDKNGVDSPKASVQHIFTPSSFKFRTPLMYTGMTSTIIRERSVQLEVCMTHKQTRQVYLMAMVHMPIRTALRRPIREKYPLIPCLNHTTPNSMRVYSATALHLHNNNNRGQNSHGHKGGHSQSPGARGGQSNGAVMPLANGNADEEELDDPVSLTGEDFLRSHLSLCLDETDDDGEDDDEDSLAKSGSSNGSNMMTSQSSNGVGSGTSSSSNTLNNPSSGDEADDDVDVAGDDDGGDDDDNDIHTKSERGELNSSGVSVSKKKIIPNEVLQNKDDLSHDSDQDLTTDGEGLVNGSPSSPSLDSAYVNPRSSQSADCADTDSGTSPHSTHSARKKIIPASVEVPKSPSEGESEGECIERAESAHTDPSPVSAFNRIPRSSHNEKNEDPPENGHVQTHAPAKPVAQSSTTSSTENSTKQNLTPAAQTTKNTPSPADPAASSLSLPADTFSPASRPETPCWDFYDFSEDLQPQGGDLESGARCLEDSLAQLRQQGIGSLQNLSMEPILPMVLVDDFDTLAVEED